MLGSSWCSGEEAGLTAASSKGTDPDLLPTLPESLLYLLFSKPSPTRCPLLGYPQPGLLRR